MNDRNWYPLNINIDDALRADFDYWNLPINDTMWLRCYDNTQLSNVFNASWLEYMQSIGLDPFALLLFYRAPHYIHPEAHIDVVCSIERQFSVAINWILDPNDDSEMVWFKCMPDSTSRTVQSVSDHSYICWPNEELTEVERHCIGRQPTLVRVDVPHNIVVNTKPRWAVSLRCKLLNTSQDTSTVDMSWNEIVDNMESYIKR